MFVLSLLTLVGCSALSDLKEDVEGLTNAIVIEGLLLGVDEPTDDRIDLSGSEFEQGAAGAVFLADAADVGDLESAPVEGAAVSLLFAKNGRVELSDEGGGSYSAGSADGLVYQDGDEATVSATFAGDTSTIAMRLPRSPDIGVPEMIEPGRDVTVDLSGQGYDNVLVYLVDLQTGESTYDNAPAGIQEFYELTHGEGSEVVVIPGAAVQQESLFMLGVAGLKNADPNTAQNANTALSAFMAGQAAFTVVSTLPPS